MDGAQRPCVAAVRSVPRPTPLTPAPYVQDILAMLDSVVPAPVTARRHAPGLARHPPPPVIAHASPAPSAPTVNTVDVPSAALPVASADPPASEWDMHCSITSMVDGLISHADSLTESAADITSELDELHTQVTTDTHQVIAEVINDAAHRMPPPILDPTDLIVVTGSSSASGSDPPSTASSDAPLTDSIVSPEPCNVPPLVPSSSSSKAPVRPPVVPYQTQPGTDNGRVHDALHRACGRISEWPAQPCVRSRAAHCRSLIGLWSYKC